jgi:predicted nucleic acid-binding Zn ribbon protein
MENNNNHNKTAVYYKTDDNRIIHEKCIRWVKKMNECLEVCIKTSGCYTLGEDTHKICKINTPDSYNKLNQHFEK